SRRSLSGLSAGGAGPRQARKYTSSVLRVRQTPMARTPAETGVVSRRSTCRRTERAIAILLPTLAATGPLTVSRRRLARKRSNRAPTGEPRPAPQGLLEADGLVPLGHAFGAGEGADLELAGRPADREMDDGHVLGLARAGRDDAGPAGRARGVPGIARLGKRARLVGFQQHGVARADPRRVAHARGAGREEIVADDLHLGGCAGEGDHAGLVAFGDRILDRHDRVALEPAQQARAPRVAVVVRIIDAQPVAPLSVELRCGDI